MKPDFDTRFDENYSIIREGFIEYLMELGYSRMSAEESNDGRDEYVKEAYAQL